jgi:hypothetical protein
MHTHTHTHTHTKSKERTHISAATSKQWWLCYEKPAIEGKTGRAAKQVRVEGKKKERKL